jgi:uncharacterized protein DUF6252
MMSNMKNVIICALTFLTAWVLSSCKKEMSIENGNDVGGNFVARIDGTRWAAASNAEQVTMVQGLINITGVSPDNREISMTLTDTVEGQYILSEQSTSMAAYMNIDSADLYAFSTDQGGDSSQAGGEVTVTRIDRVNRTMSGTFSFKVYRSIDGRQHTITSGVFNKLPYSTTLPPSAPGDTLQAIIDGSVWTAVSIQASINSGELSIEGSVSDGSKSIGLLLPSGVAAGTYALDGSNPQYVGVYSVLANTTNFGFVSNQGSLTVLSNDTAGKRIRGTFQFTAASPSVGNTGTHSITSGMFSVYYGP